MGKIAELEAVLEIFLITYNRSAKLDNTLRQLKDSPFSRCRFTVLDNCSTDETPDIAARYRDEFPNYRVIRHPRNIGGDYNFLRAVELSTSFYTWILCDDDNYDFTYAQDVIAAIESCMYGLVYVAGRSSVQLDWPGFGSTRVRQLISEGARYHRACVFWPSLIFRTEWYTNYCFHNAPYLFPSLKFINLSIADDWYIYVAQHEIVIRSETSTSENAPLVMYREWVSNAALVTDKKLKQYIIEQWTDKGFMRTLFFWIAMDRANRVEGYWKRLVDIMFGLTPIQRFKFLFLLPVMIIPVPRSILIRAREMAYKIMGHEDTGKLPPVDIEKR